MIEPFHADREPRLFGDRLRESVVVCLDRAGFDEPERIHNRMQHAIALPLGNLLGLQQQITAVGGHGLVRFDPTEPGILVPQITERDDEQPLERRLPLIEHGPRRRLCRRCHEPFIPCALVEQRGQRARHQSLAMAAGVMADLRHQRGLLIAAAPAIDRLGRDVETRHDGRIHRGKIQLTDLFVIADDRREHQSALIGLQQLKRGFEGFRLLLPVGNQQAVTTSNFELHRGDPRPCRRTGHLLQIDLRDTGLLDEACQAHFRQRKRILPIEMQSSRQRPGTSMGQDAAVRKIRMGFPGADGSMGIAIERERHSQPIRHDHETRQKVGIAPVRQENVGVLSHEQLVESLNHIGIIAFQQTFLSVHPHHERATPAMIRVGRRTVRRQLHDRKRWETIVRVPGRLQSLNRLNPAFDGEVNLAMDQRKELPVVKVALWQRHIHVKELRVGIGADQTLRDGRKLGGSMNRNFQHRDRTKRAEFISFHLSGADTTGGTAE